MTILAKTKKSEESKKQSIDIELDGETLDTDSGKAEDAPADETPDTQCESDPVETLFSELAAERDKYLRLAAEYDNFRKRSAKEREIIYSNARIDAITKLLPIYDNIERAMKMECSDEAFYKGIEMIMTQLTEVFSDMGVTEIPATGEQFDPNLHNAVMTVENKDLGNNIVAEECQKGFILGDRVIRFSTVVVTN